MNPWALVVMGAALVLIILSVKGTQDNAIAAILGRQYGNSAIK